MLPLIACRTLGIAGRPVQDGLNRLSISHIASVYRPRQHQLSTARMDVAYSEQHDRLLGAEPHEGWTAGGQRRRFDGENSLESVRALRFQSQFERRSAP